MYQEGSEMFLHRSVSLAAAILAMAAMSPPAHASSYTVMWNFRQAAYGLPHGRLLLQGGSLFGTTAGQSPGDGTAFQLTKAGNAWNAKLLFAFNGTKGATPFAGLVRDSGGSLYGTTEYGGANDAGTVFRLSQSNGKWTATVLHAFGATGDGSYPQGDLVFVPSTTTFYGTTTEGGAYGEGSVFSLAYSGGAWKESVLYSFQGLEDGREPLGGLYRDSSGVLYGTASYAGAYGVGTLFEVTPSNGSWTEKKLHDFANGSDGAVPSSSLIADASGALYGTTYDGGVHSCGTVFKFAESGGRWKETVLWSFAGETGDGANPEAAPHMDAAGTLYGTTGFGGSNNDGTVFELKQSGGSWTESVLHDFGDGSDGKYPAAAVIEDPSGNLYGTTIFGGKYTYGTVFKLTP
jgi:uncharacterized repeat protein (TIGR03803 family)